MSERLHESLLDHLLGEAQVPEATRERGYRTTRALAEDAFDVRLLDALHRGPELSGRLLEGAHFDWSAARDRRLLRPRQGGVEVGGLDDPEPSDVLLGLQERAVGEEKITPLLGPDHGRARRRVQTASEDPRPLLQQRLVERIDVRKQSASCPARTRRTRG